MESHEPPSKKRRISGSFDDNCNDSQICLKKSDESSQLASELLSNPKSSQEVTSDSLSKEASEKVVQVCPNELEQAEEQEEAIDLTSSKLQMSKNQIKKLRRQEEWRANAAARKAKRKEKIKEKKKRKREAQKAAEDTDSNASPNAPSQPKSEEHAELKLHSKQLPITFVIDCGFDDLMADKERISLASQLTRSYSENHRALLKGHLVISSFGGHLKERFETVLSGHHQNWKNVRFLHEDFVEASELAKGWMAGNLGGRPVGAFHSGTNAETEVGEGEEGSGDVIYLSSDSPNTLAELKPYSTYIIGGLVDRNRHKGICYKRAMDRGIRTAKLPIGDYMEMTSRFVLATNHVIEIMLRWLELGHWGEAFLRVIPKRKGGILKGQEGQKATQELDSGNDIGEQDQREDQEEAQEDHDSTRLTMLTSCRL